MFTNETPPLEDLLRQNIEDMVIELSYNKISPHQPLMRVCKPGTKPTSSPINILGGIIVGDSHPQLLRMLADALELATLNHETSKDPQ